MHMCIDLFAAKHEDMEYLEAEDELLDGDLFTRDSLPSKGAEESNSWKDPTLCLHLGIMP